MNLKGRLFSQRLFQVNTDLKKASFRSYLRILRLVLDSHRDVIEFKPLSDALRAKDYGTLLREAGLLSSQKYDDHLLHFKCNQLSLFIRKYPWDPKLIGADPLQTAIDDFTKANRRCARINSKFGLLKIDPSRDPFRDEGKRAMQWIRGLIGSSPRYDRIFRRCDFGNGASVGVHGSATHILRKLSSETAWTVGPGAINHAFGGLLNNAHYLESLLDRGPSGVVCHDYEAAFKKYVSRLDVVDYNKLAFVNKTAMTHRSIAMEPTFSGFVQKGIDEELRSFLLNVNIDLTDQTRNQRLAREGSVDDSLDGFVTMDIRGASNSVAYSPVKYLFPEAWYDLLWRTRSHNYKYRDEVKPYHMLCSMGNGFCFPIETLMFAAICYACDCGTPGVDFSVYGDDIIVRKRHAAKVMSMLRHYGYSMNTDKTFVEGPFRESCGADWFSGVDVRPFTLDYKLDSVENIFKFLNLSRRSKATTAFFDCVRSAVIALLPDDFRFFRPLPGDPDTGIDSTGDEHLNSPHCLFKRGKWKWKKLVHDPIIDVNQLRLVQNDPWIIGIALRGSMSIPSGELMGLPAVTFRRKTRTKLASDSYASTSNWLPRY